MVANTIRSGDMIGLVAPSHIADEERYRRIISALESKGFCVKTGKNLYKSTYGYSASEFERAEDFNLMVLDDDVKMIFFGGGEGGNELLPYLDFKNIASHPKIICSFSDGTTILNTIYANTGLLTYYGQAPGIFEDLRYYDYRQFTSHFIDGHVDTFESNSQWKTISKGICEGVLIGGYTRNFALLLSNKYFPYNHREKYVLFLEDHETFCGLAEVSSYISHIEQSEFVNNVAGLLFGHYKAELCPELYQRLERFGEKHNIPVIYCDDFGHGVNHAILPIGGKVRLDAEEKTLNFFPVM